MNDDFMIEDVQCLLDTARMVRKDMMDEGMPAKPEHKAIFLAEIKKVELTICVLENVLNSLKGMALLFQFGSLLCSKVER